MLGDLKNLVIDDQRYLYVFERSYLNEKVTVALNNGSRNQFLQLAVANKYWIDLLSGNSYVAIDGKIALKIESRSGSILIPGLETRLADRCDYSPQRAQRTLRK